MARTKHSMHAAARGCGRDIARILLEVVGTGQWQMAMDELTAVLVRSYQLSRDLQTFYIQESVQEMEPDRRSLLPGIIPIAKREVKKAGQQKTWPNWEAMVNWKRDHRDDRLWFEDRMEQPCKEAVRLGREWFEEDKRSTGTEEGRIEEEAYQKKIEARLEIVRSLVPKRAPLAAMTTSCRPNTCKRARSADGEHFSGHIDSADESSAVEDASANEPPTAANSSREGASATAGSSSSKRVRLL
ncbi:hypothetical protein JVT61DRAFT_12305 [Boletus reticuloceps]|uniref:Uncharacterized protein n=1 Tax=Boletus reticuloceps TaxID=495285 RepID=A0A8I3A4C0_9AGAM|nr:hypothetical protein JVT61DRAFT_12305 [Boletus reticuloceps]